MSNKEEPFSYTESEALKKVLGEKEEEGLLEPAVFRIRLILMRIRIRIRRSASGIMDLDPGLNKFQFFLIIFFL